MRFGTFYFFQAPPGHRHDDIIRRELEQIEWTEELGFDEIWLTEHHFIDYGLSVDPAAAAAAAAAPPRRRRPRAPGASASGSPRPSCPSTTRFVWRSRWRWSTSSPTGGSTWAWDAAIAPPSSAATVSRRKRAASASTRRWRSCGGRGPRIASATTGASSLCPRCP